MTDNQPTQNTRWHRLLGTLLEELLPQVNIDVTIEAPIMSQPPRVDVLLLRRQNEKWTTEQRSLLPDGIRDTKASHVLLEFKYTESINWESFRQVIGYEFLYRETKQLTHQQIQPFILSAKKTQPRRLIKFGYKMSKHKGVYHSSHPLLKRIPLISLNELSNAPYNAWAKCFASQKNQKEEAFSLLRQHTFQYLTIELEWFLAGLYEYWFDKQGEDMKRELTTERVIELGKIWGETYLSTLKTEDLLPYLKPEDVLASPIYQQWRENTLQQAVQQAVQQTRFETHLEDQRFFVENLLQFRFGVVDDALAQLIDPLLQLPQEESLPLVLQSSREELLAKFN